MLTFDAKPSLNADHSGRNSAIVEDPAAIFRSGLCDPGLISDQDSDFAILLQVNLYLVSWMQSCLTGETPF